MVRVPGVQAAEGVLGQAEGGGPVQVAVPPDLDAYDASLRIAGRDRASFPRGPFRNEVCRRLVEKPGPRAYLDGHILEAVSCVLHYFAEAEDGAERICQSIINARFEVGRGDVWKNIPPKVGRKQKIEARKISTKSRNCVRDVDELARLATTYLLKLNLGYQMLFLTKRVKFSAAFK